MKDIIIIIVLAVIVFLAAGYIYRAKKSGRKCIGCPHGDHCSTCGGCGSIASDPAKDSDEAQK